MQVRTMAAIAVAAAAAVAPAPAHAAHRLQSSCTFTGSTLTGPNSLLMALVGQVQAGDELVGVSTTLVCELEDSDGNVVLTATGGGPGPVGVAANAGVVPNHGPFTICATASATWLDGHTVSNPRSCLAPA